MATRLPTAVLLVAAAVSAGAAAAPEAGALRLSAAETALELNRHILADLGLEVVFRQPVGEEGGFVRAIFPAAAPPSLRLRAPDGSFEGLDGGTLRHRGGFELLWPGGRQSMLGFELAPAAASAPEGALFELRGVDGAVPFFLTSPHPEYLPDLGEFVFLNMDLRLTESFARRLGAPELAGIAVGSGELRTSLAAPLETSCTVCESNVGEGLDVDVELTGITFLTEVHHGGGRVAMSPYVDLHNIGPSDVEWYRPIYPDGGFDPAIIGPHPFLVLSFYRLADGALHQIGRADVKHAFFAANSNCACCRLPDPLCRLQRSLPGGDQPEPDQPGAAAGGHRLDRRLAVDGLALRRRAGGRRARPPRRRRLPSGPLRAPADGGRRGPPDPRRPVLHRGLVRHARATSTSSTAWAGARWLPQLGRRLGLPVRRRRRHPGRDARRLDRSRGAAAGGRGGAARHRRGASRAGQRGRDASQRRHPLRLRPDELRLRPPGPLVLGAAAAGGRAGQRRLPRRRSGPRQRLAAHRHRHRDHLVDPGRRPGSGRSRLGHALQLPFRRQRGARRPRSDGRHGSARGGLADAAGRGRQGTGELVRLRPSAGRRRRRFRPGDRDQHSVRHRLRGGLRRALRAPARRSSCPPPPSPARRSSAGPRAAPPSALPAPRTPCSIGTAF